MYTKPGSASLDIKKEFAALVQKGFPVPKRLGMFNLFPVSNELGWPAIIKNLKQITVPHHENINVSLLFGDSNFLSLLPWISSSVVLLADITAELHACTAFSMQCFGKSNSPQEFLEYFFDNHPCLNFKNFETKKNFTQQEVRDSISYSMKLLGKHHFLSSQENFEQCKGCFEKITLIQIGLNLADENKCRQLNNILSTFSAKLVLVNITNIHHYVNNYQIENSVENLIDNQKPLMIYSTKIGNYYELRAICVSRLDNNFFDNTIHSRWGYEQFLQIRSAYPKLIADNSFFCKVKKEIKPEKDREFCYLGYAVNEKKLRDFLEDKEELNACYSNLRAHNTEQEATEFVVNEIKKNNASQYKDKQELSYWIITFRGTKEKINPCLRSFDEKGFIVNMTDQYAARLKLSSRVLCAVNQDKSVVINKELPVTEVFSQK